MITVYNGSKFTTGERVLFRPFTCTKIVIDIETVGLETYMARSRGCPEDPEHVLWVPAEKRLQVEHDVTRTCGLCLLVFFVVVHVIDIAYSCTY